MQGLRVQGVVVEGGCGCKGLVESDVGASTVGDNDVGAMVDGVDLS